MIDPEWGDDHPRDQKQSAVKRVVVFGFGTLLAEHGTVLKVDLDGPALTVGVLAQARARSPRVDHRRLLGQGDVVAEGVVLAFAASVIEDELCRFVRKKLDNT